MTALASVRDLELRMSRTFDTDDDVAEAESALDEASEIVRETGSQLWVSTAEAPRIARTVTLRLAGRKIRNPDGLSAENAGDYSYQRPGVTADGPLHLTAWETMVLRRAAGRRSLWTQAVSLWTR